MYIYFSNRRDTRQFILCSCAPYMYCSGTVKVAHWELETRKFSRIGKYNSGEWHYEVLVVWNFMKFKSF